MEGRHVDPAATGLWVSAYWGMFTVGRVTAGFITRWLTPLAFIRISMIGAVVAALILVLNPAQWTGGLALGLMGFAFAPIFPMLVSVTPRRVGEQHIANTIGFQIGAAAIGGSMLPALTGILAKTVSIEAMPVLLLIVNSALLILHELIVRSPQSNEKPARQMAAASSQDR
jgi:fucose permease